MQGYPQDSDNKPLTKAELRKVYIAKVALWQFKQDQKKERRRKVKSVILFGLSFAMPTIGTGSAIQSFITPLNAGTVIISLIVGALFASGYLYSKKI